MNRTSITKNNDRRIKHGLYKTVEYSIWRGMRQRCNDKNFHGHHRYGGRGIKVCERWNDFAAFLQDMGKRPSCGHSIERINNDGDYEPSNCKWATLDEQAQNKRKKQATVPKSKFICKKCNKEYFKVKWHEGKSFYCSDTCRLSSYRINCIRCNKEVASKISRPKKYCSHECYWESMRK